MQKHHKWTAEMDAKLAASFTGRRKLDQIIDDRIASYMRFLSTGRREQVGVPSRAIVAAAKAVGATTEQVESRLTCIMRERLGLSTAESKRGPRREQLRRYSAAGARSLADIMAADAESAAKATPPATPAAMVMLMPSIPGVEVPAAGQFDQAVVELERTRLRLALAAEEFSNADEAFNVAKHRFDSLVAGVRASIADHVAK